MVAKKSLCCLHLIAFVASCWELLREYELSKMKSLLGLTIVLLVWPLLNNISAIRRFQILPRKKGLWAKINFSTMSPKNKSVQPKSQFWVQSQTFLELKLVEIDWMMRSTNQMDAFLQGLTLIWIKIWLFLRRGCMMFQSLLAVNKRERSLQIWN